MGKTLWGLVVLVCTVAAFVVAAMWWMPPTRAIIWLVVLGCLALAFAGIGMATLGRPTAVLIDNRNMYSLSRLQIALWTLLIVAAYLVAAMSNIMAVSRGTPADGAVVADPLVIAIPPAIWVLLGINVTAWVGSPLILSTKKDQAPQPDQADNTIMRLNSTIGPRPTPPGFAPTNAARGQAPLADPLPPVYANEGKVVTKVDSRYASLADLFYGEETGNATQLDLGKIQLFYFTLIVAVVYGVSLFVRFRADGPIRAFPELDSSIVALLGISNAGYLTNKAVPHSQ